MEKKQSSVEWLALWVYNNTDCKPEEIKKAYQEAKAMHKQEHEETWIDAKIEDKGDDYIGKEMTFEKYYNETFKTK